MISQHELRRLANASKAKREATAEYDTARTSVLSKLGKKDKVEPGELSVRCTHGLRRVITIEDIRKILGETAVDLLNVSLRKRTVTYVTVIDAKTQKPLVLRETHEGTTSDAD